MCSSLPSRSAFTLAQRDTTQALFKDHEGRGACGRPRIITAEGELDRKFALEKHQQEPSLHDGVREVASLQGDLGDHLKYHLAMTGF